MEAKRRGVLVGLLFFVLIGISIVSMRYGMRSARAAEITEDLSRLSAIFKRIDDECLILSFDGQKNSINFLNVGSFSGSEVGPMNVAYPAKWQGPYLAEDLTAQSINYQIVRTKKGYFITPGDGVKLPNKKIMGKDILLDENADITAMMHDPAKLFYEGKAFAVPLGLKSNTFSMVLSEDDEF